MGLPCGVFNTCPEEDMAILRTRAQWVLMALALLLAISLPWIVKADWLTVLIQTGIYLVAVLGLHVLTGLCGQFSMGHAAFMMVGAYAAGLLATKAGFPAWATLPFAGLAAGVAGLLFGIPALRIKGFYLVVSTIAAQFILTWIFREAPGTGGVHGISMPRLVFFGNAVTMQGFWWLVLAIIVPMVYFAKNIQRTSFGRKFIAVRDNDLAAEVMGINLFRTKLLAFFIGCMFAGVAGWLWAYFYTHINPDQFNFQLSLLFLGMVIVGGIGSTTGVIFGAVIMRFMEKLVDDYISDPLGRAFPEITVQIAPAMSLIVFALVVLFFIRVEPRGAYHQFLKLKTYYRLHPFSY